MSQLIWRLHRRQVYWATCVLVVLAVVLIVSGINMSNHYHSFLTTCAATQTCSDASTAIFSSDQFAIDMVDLTLIVPALLGMFWGAPLLAKEFEEGTQNLAWTQGVTRRKWFSVNLAWVFAAAIVWTGILTILVTWWRSPENAIEARFAPAHFDIQGIVPIAYAVFAVALGITAGVLVRRVLPAIALTIGAFFAVRLAVRFLARPHFMPAVTKVFPLGSQPSGAWIISGQNFGPSGSQLGKAFNPSQQCAAVAKTNSVQCLASHGYHQLLTYQPASRFWAFQGIEFAIFAVLAAGLLAIAYRLVLRHDA